MLTRKTYISNLPDEKIKKCVIAGQAEVVDTLLKRVILLDRATMQLLAVRNVNEDDSWELISQDKGDGNHILIGLDEGGNFNLSAFDRVSLGVRTFPVNPDNYQDILASTNAFYVSAVHALRFDDLGEVKLPGEQEGLRFNTAFGNVSPFKDGYPADFQCDWKAMIDETEVQPVFYSIDPSKVSETVENFRAGIDLSMIPEIFDEITGVGDISIIFETGDFLDFEVESFDTGLKKGLIWTVLPYVSADAITYWALVYNLSESLNSGPEGSVANDIWDDYLFVHHMTEDPVGTDACVDSAGENHGTPENMALANRSFGPLSGYEYEFNGTDETINLGNLCPEGLMEGTIEVVFKASQNEGHILSQDADGWNDRDVNLSIGDPTGVASTVADGYLNFEAQGPEISEVKNITSTVAVNDGNYHYAGVSWYRDNFGLILDDTVDVPQIEYKMWGTGDFKVGADGTSFFNGSIGEVLISDKPKSLEYCKLLNKSLNDSLITYTSGLGVWLGGWGFRITLTIDNTKIDEDLYNYPITVNLSASAGLSSQDLTDIFSNMTYEDRKKVLFTLGDGVTLCVAECECWDDVNQFATYHVKIPNISSSADTVFYVYFDPNADDQSDYTDDTGTITAQSVWPSNHVGVWHMAQDPSQGGACILDSTSNENHGTPTGSMTQSDLVNGLVGKGLDFDGIDDLITITDQSFNYDIVTLEGIAKTTYSGDLEKYIASNVQSGGFGINREEVSGVDRFRNTMHINGSYSSVISNDAHDTTSFYHVAGRYNQVSQNLFVDGAKQTATYSNTNPITNVSVDFCIGCNAPSGGNWRGVICEVRLSDAALSDAWIKTTNYSLRDDLLTFDEIESPIVFSADEQVQNLPVKISLSASSGINNIDMTSKVISQSANILVRHNGQPVKAEIAYWDTGVKGVIWTLLPEVASGINTLAIADTGEAVITTGSIGGTVGQEVWEDYQAAYHLCQDPAVAIKDSTGNNADATPVNMDASNLVNGVTVFNGTDEVINLGAIFDGIQDAGQVHIEFKTSQAEAPILMQDGEGVYVTTGKVKIDSGSNDASLNAFNDDTLHAVSFQFDNHKRDLFVDGVDQIPYEIFGSTGTADLIMAGNYLGASFQGNIPELRFNQKSEYQHKLLLQGKLWNQTLMDIPNDPLIIPAISFDEGNTYKIWNGSAWRAIVSNDDAVHGDTGDTDWHYVDAGTTWEKTVENTFDAALTAAIQYAENRNHAETLSCLDSSQWTSTGGIGVDGSLTLAFGYNQNITGLIAEIESVSADGMLLALRSIDLEPYDGIITGSKIEWCQKVIDSTYDYSQVEVYSHITGGTWQLCTRNEAIPGITAEMDTTGLTLDFKIKAPLDFPENSKISITPKIF